MVHREGCPSQRYPAYNAGPCNCAQRANEELAYSLDRHTDALRESNEQAAELARLREENKALREVANDVVADAALLHHMANLAEEGENAGQAALRLFRERAETAEAERDALRAQLDGSTHMALIREGDGLRMKIVEPEGRVAGLEENTIRLQDGYDAVERERDAAREEAAGLRKQLEGK